MPTPTAPDLPAITATTLLPELGLRHQATEAASPDPAQLLSSVASPQPDGADATANTDELLALAAQQACALTGADGSAVALLEGDSVVCRARAGLIAPKIGASVNLRSTFTGRCFRTGQVLCSEDTEHDPRVNRASCRKVGVGSILVVPVGQPGKPVGIVEVFSTSPARFGAREITALESMAREIADALRAGEAVERPQPGESEPAPASPLVLLEDIPGGEVRNEVAECGEPASEPEQDTLAQQPKRPIRIPWLVFSTLAVSCATIGFAGHQGGYVARAPAPLRPSVRIEPPPPRKIASAVPPPQMVATGPGVLLGLKHNSHPDFTSITIELSAPVKVKAEQLSDPERIYFDLAETRIASEFIDAMHTKAITIEDRFLSRVRVAQRSEDTTRVVLDLNRRCEFTYVMSDAPPFRLVIELHAATKHTGSTEMARDVAATAPSSAAPASPPERNRANLNRPLRIVIDPGHGGWDNGSVGPTGLLEKKLVLDVAERLSRLLQERLGAEIILTRTDDTFVPLESRPALANSVGADLFLSIHANSSSANDVRGVETYYITPAAYKGSDRRGAESAVTASRRLAAAVQRALYAGLSGADPLVHDRGVKAAALSVLEAPEMPSVLTEIAFLTNRREEQKLRRPEYRETIAEALFKGIEAYAAKRPPTPVRTASQTASSADHAGDLASDDLPGKSAERGR